MDEIYISRHNWQLVHHWYSNFSYVIFDVLMNIQTIQYNLTTSGTYISNAPKKKPIAHSFMNLNYKLQE